MTRAIKEEMSVATRYPKLPELHRDSSYAYAWDASTRDGTRTVQIHCPYCGSDHTHGWNLPTDGKDDHPGHRNVHCREPRHEIGERDGYVVVIPKEVWRKHAV